MPLDLLEQILPHIKKSIYPFTSPLSEWRIKEADLVDGYSTKVKDSSWPTFEVPSFWGGYDRTSWFRRKIVIPPELSGKPVAVLLDLPEALVFVDGKPFQGIDKHHQEVFLTHKAKAEQEYLFAIQAYSGRSKHVSTFNMAVLVVVDSTAKELYQALLTLCEIEKLYGQGSSESKEIRELIRRTLIFLKYFDPQGEEYPNAIDRARTFLKRTLEEEVRTPIEGLIHLVAQSQLDVAWRWTFAETRRKCARTFSTVLQLLDEFPLLQFHQGQALLYEFLKQDYPKLYKKVKVKIQEGQWKPIGSSWVEHDCHLLSGESIIRQIHYGKKFFISELGKDSFISWYPDTFGFPASLPQILSKAGIKYFFTTKLNWNDTTDFPYHTFTWKGIDGSSVLAHNPPLRFDGQLTSQVLRDTWEKLLHKEVIQDVLLPFGFGNNGGGPTREQVIQSMMPTEIAGLPKIQLSTPEAFFERMEAQQEAIPIYAGELYLEKYRGMYTTQGWVKKANRECEVELYSAELLSTLAMINSGTASSRRYRSKELDRAWQALLTNQSQQVIGGTSIVDAYFDVKEGFEKVFRLTQSISTRSLKELTTKPKKKIAGQSFSIFNTLGWERDGYVEFTLKPKEKYFDIVDEQKNSLEYQVLNRIKGCVQILCYVDKIPPFSGKTIFVRPSAKKPEIDNPWRISARIIDGPIFKIRFDSNGQLTSIYDKRLRKEILKKGQRGNHLQAFIDRPAEWEAWELNEGFDSKKSDILHTKSVKVIQHGPLLTSLQIMHKTLNGSTLIQEMRSYHKLARIDFKTHVDWSDKQIILKAAFPTNVKASKATYEIPLGSIRRSTKRKNPEEKGMFEVPSQQWADVSDSKFGVSLINDSKYGYDVKGGTLRLTLLRSPHFTHEIDPATQHDNRCTDQGEHFFSYALYPHKGDWGECGTIRQAREFNNPLMVLKNTVMKPIAPLITSSPTNIYISAVKKAENDSDIILRLYEGHGKSSKGTIEFGYSVLQAAECDLLENVVAKLKPSRSRLNLKFGAYEIKTLKLKLKAKKRIKKR